MRDQRGEHIMEEGVQTNDVVPSHTHTHTRTPSVVVHKP